MIEDIIRSIREAEDINTLLFLLKDLYDEAQRTLDGNKTNMQEAVDLWLYVKVIRTSLRELEYVNKQQNNDRRAGSVAFLNECFHRLETRIEETMKNLKIKCK